LTAEPCFHGWYGRRELSCYSEETHETEEMLNMNNCYFCFSRDDETCPDVDEFGHAWTPSTPKVANCDDFLWKEDKFGAGSKVLPRCN
jgi:hypothetical protein